MAIYHLEHSYLNWRVIPCKRRMICVYVAFSSFSQHFLASWFLFRNNQIFQVHDMTINFSFVLFFFFILVICLLWAMMHAIHGPPGWNISSHMRIVLKGWPFGPRLFISFLSKKRIMAQKYFRKMSNFGQRAPRHQSRWSQNIMILETCVFGSSEEFW